MTSTTTTSAAVGHRSRANRNQWWTRPDPYWDPDIHDVNITWTHRYLRTRLPVAKPNGGWTTRTFAVPDYTHSTPRWLASTIDPGALRSTMAYLCAWHVASTTQLETALDIPKRTTQHLLKQLFDAGYIQRGVVHCEGRKLPYLWRPNTGHEPFRRWWSAMSDPARLATFGSVDQPGTGPTHVRHNLLAGELALRLNELHQGQAVYHEDTCDPTVLIPHPNRHIPDTQRADLAWVRADGLRVLFEITQTRNPHDAVTKMRRWAAHLGNDTLRASGVIVVFVNSSARDHHQLTTGLRKSHLAAMSPTGLSHMAQQAVDHRFLNEARSKMLVASWEDWFPAPNTVAPSFLELTCTARTTTDQWRPVNLADPTKVAFQPADHPKWTTPARRAPTLDFVPRWATPTPQELAE